MDITETRTLVAGLLADIAPEADLGDVADGEDLRQALDIDSMDFLNLVIAIHERTGIEIPEADYPKLFTLAGMSAYLSR